MGRYILKLVVAAFLGWFCVWLVEAPTYMLPVFSWLIYLVGESDVARTSV